MKETDARLRAMVATHFNFIWRSLRGLGLAQMDADDAAQHVFWIAAQKLDAIAVGSERAFLFATARGVAANARRAKERDHEVFDERALDVAPDESLDPEQQMQRREALALLEHALSRLPDDLRVVFVLFELEDMTSIQIAEMLRIPTGTAASRLRRAREAFTRVVEKLRTARGAA